MTNNITIIQGMPVIEYSKFIANSSMVPKEYRGKPADIYIAIEMGMELGLKPLQALQNIAVINGKPSIYADGLMAVCRSHPSFENINETFDEKKQIAYCTIKRKGQDAQTRSFSVEEAKKAGLWGRTGPWQTYPKRMLQMRARGFALRDVFADAIKGIITVEEAQDYPLENKELKEVNSKTEFVSSKLDDLLDNVIDLNNEIEVTEITKEEELVTLINQYNISDDIIQKWLDKAGVNDLKDLPEDKIEACIQFVKEKY